MSFQLVPTADGSLSYLDATTGELSHNRAGAYTESVQLYAKPSGLLELAMNQDEIRLLDACFGMGYNSWSLINELVQLEKDHRFTAMLAERTCDKAITVSLVCIEKAPEVLEFLPQVLALPTFDPLKEKIAPSEHNTYYRTLQCLSDTKGVTDRPRKLVMDVAPFWRFELELWVDDLRQRVPQLTGEFDAVFHDAYSPQKMPELWTLELFNHYFRLLQRRSGKLLTYSTAAAVRGGLIAAGFSIAKTPGLGTKAGGTFAYIPTSDVEAQLGATEQIFEPFAQWEHEYLQSKAGLPYRDPGLCQERAAILENRLAEQAASPRPSGAQALKKKPRYQKTASA